MKKLIILFISVFFLGGCLVTSLLVGAGLVTGYTLGNDSATGNVKSEYSELWSRSLEIIKTMRGDVIGVNESKGIIKAKVTGNDVVIKIDSLDTDIQRLRVSARKYFIPKQNIAQNIFVKIVRNP